MKELLPLAARLPAGPNVSMHLLSNNALVRKYGNITDKIPFHPCSAHWLFAAEVLPSHVEDVIYMGTDQLVVDDLELLWHNAFHMGWDRSKLFANPEERIKQTICRANGKARHLKNNKSKEEQHLFFLSGIATGSNIFSLRNSRRYGLVEWISQVLHRFPPSSFALGDQTIVNRYGMEYPERMTLLQCNVDVRAIWE